MQRLSGRPAMKSTKRRNAISESAEPMARACRRRPSALSMKSATEPLWANTMRAAAGPRGTTRDSGCVLARLTPPLDAARMCPISRCVAGGCSASQAASGESVADTGSRLVVASRQALSSENAARPQPLRLVHGASAWEKNSASQGWRAAVRGAAWR